VFDSTDAMPDDDWIDELLEALSQGGHAKNLKELHLSSYSVSGFCHFIYIPRCEMRTQKHLPTDPCTESHSFVSKPSAIHACLYDYYILMHVHVI